MVEILSPNDWHARFTQQARWTRDLRHYLYERAGLKDARRVLEVGCGTGAILAELGSLTRGEIHGLDLNSAYLAAAKKYTQAKPELAMRINPSAQLAQGDAHSLPYPAAAFDLTLCHFLLLWVADPVQVVGEMVRVTRPGGAVLALAEPDYGGRIDYPQELAPLGEWQRDALRRQGADPLLGRRLGEIFHRARLKSIESGVLGGQWLGPPSPDEWEMEWRVLEADMQQTPGVLKTPGVSELRELDRAAWERGERVLFVPTFWAWGSVPLHPSTGTPTSICPSTTRTG